MIDYDDRDDGQQEAWATEYEEWCREQYEEWCREQYEEWCREQDDEDEINELLREAANDDA